MTNSNADPRFDGMRERAKTLEYQLAAVPTKDLPAEIPALLKGLLRACSDHDITLGSLLAPTCAAGPQPIENRDYADARVYAMQRAGRESYGHMFVFLQQRLIDHRTNTASMVRAHNIQLDMISELAAERNKLAEKVKVLERDKAVLKFHLEIEQDEM